MCGITGFIALEAVPSDVLKHMNHSLYHRGPDAEGYYYNHTVGLAHRRLSIIDLSSAANQPFFSYCKNYVMVYNGEVYNYKELARKYNLSLRTTSDTEVVIELFAKFGPGFVCELNGMFAFAIYDIRRHRLFLFRDRIGVKPLFVYSGKNGFFFASEIKAFKIPFFTLEINKKCIGGFLHLGVIAEPETIYKNLEKFPSAHYAEISSGKIQYRKYWDIGEKISRTVINDEEQAKEELKNLLESSVKYRLISDVPFGVFLSGGIDSSLVTAIAQNISTAKIKTFSIGFKENNFNESTYSRAVANYLHTEHYEYTVSEKEARDIIWDVIDHYDEPFADTSSIPTYIVSRLASNTVKMILSGDGGDELFLGYGSYNWARLFSNPMVYYNRKILAFFLRVLGSDRLKRISKLLDYTFPYNLQSHILSQEQYYFDANEINCLVGDEYKKPSEHIYTYSIAAPRRLSLQEKQSLFDITHYLKDDLMVKVDRASMKASIEAREPLLDYRLIEFAINLDENLKNRNSVQKYILREVLYQYLPPSMFDRPKWGFGIPLSVWLKGELKFLIDEYLSEKSINDVGIFNYANVAALKYKFSKGHVHLYNRIWLIIVLQHFFKFKK
ncbi:MAG: asparagine synthase (glutamine-hydrolyzing) [Cytophagaceae bacterium]|nr:asparagine synthase (glutamine-hydrolyzing) [Cytophagaceae bacterium]MDW8456211.1 asparagine synthase (glutamine-hydrolyzing) [Cytophagaceae bacterium]